MQQMKISLCCKMLSRRIRIKKNTCKNQKSWTPYLLAQGDHTKTIKVIKLLCVKCVPVTTGITKRTGWSLS